MVRADLERLVSPHYQSRLLILLVSEQPDIARTALFPLLAFSVKLEQLGAHLEHLLLTLLIRGRLDFFGQVNDGLKVRVFALLYFFLL